MVRWNKMSRLGSSDKLTTALQLAITSPTFSPLRHIIVSLKTGLLWRCTTYRGKHTLHYTLAYGRMWILGSERKTPYMANQH